MENINYIWLCIIVLLTSIVGYIGMEIFNLGDWFFDVAIFYTPIVVLTVLFILSDITRKSRHWDPLVKINIKSIIERQKALKNANIYLRPYENIWNNLKLFNKQCQISFDYGIINCYNVTSGNYVGSFKIIDFQNLDSDEIWNQLCYFFNYQTTYEKTKNFFINKGLEVVENDKFSIKSDDIKFVKDTKVDSLIDINNASQKILSSLSGINIILAKRIIKRREEIQGFKSVEEFLEFTKLNEHAKEKLKDRIKIDIMKTEEKTKSCGERKIDL